MTSLNGAVPPSPSTVTSVDPHWVGFWENEKENAFEGEIWRLRLRRVRIR
jgi:hypothetical protein